MLLLEAYGYSRVFEKLMNTTKSLWVFLDVLEKYGHLIERESLEGLKELYTRESSRCVSVRSLNILVHV